MQIAEDEARMQWELARALRDARIGEDADALAEVVDDMEVSRMYSASPRIKQRYDILLAIAGAEQPHASSCRRK